MNPPGGEAQQTVAANGAARRRGVECSASKTGAGSLKLFVNGNPAGEGKLTRVFFRHGLEPFEVGRDSLTPVDPAYKDKGKFEFTGKIEKVAFELTNR